MGAVVGIITLTVQFAVFPFTVLTVMVVAPSLTAVTLPELFTVATDEFEVDHVTVLFVALEGDIVADRVYVLPSPVKVTDVFDKLTFVGLTVVSTVTMQVAVFPFTVFAVIVAIPSPTAVTLPELFTVATDEFEVDHVTVLVVALEGDTVADKVYVLPLLVKVTNVLDKLILVGLTVELTLSRYFLASS